MSVFSFLKKHVLHIKTSIQLFLFTEQKISKTWQAVRALARKRYEKNKYESRNSVSKRNCIDDSELDFLWDDIVRNKKIKSLLGTNAACIPVQEEREGKEQKDDTEEDELQEITSTSSPHSSAPNVLQVEDDDNQQFLLFLKSNLALLPPHLKTSCQTEIVQWVNMYVASSQQNQQRPTTPSRPGYPQCNPQQQHQSQQLHQLQPTHQTQMYVLNQLHASSSYTSDQQQSESQQDLPTTFMTPGPTSSPAESPAFYILN